MSYNKLFIFDLDGVLIESRELHYESLNDALRAVDEKYIISREEHLSTYDGLPTTSKLKMLTKNKNLPVDLYDKIWQYKQDATFSRLRGMEKSNKLIEICEWLQSKDYKIAVASNSIRNTVKISLLSLGILEYVDYMMSNEDVGRSKPHPEMYWKCMISLNAIPRTTIIAEDSHIGRQGAIDSGATLLPIENSYDLTLNKIKEIVMSVENTSVKPIAWRDKRMNVLIPMAGAGTRFASAGYTFPKPLIEVGNKTMIQTVVDNLNIDANYIFIVQKEHYEKYNLKSFLNVINNNCKIVQVDGVTEGAACTTLLAREFIDNDNPLLIANSDQFVEWNSNEALYAFNADSVDGGILTFKASHPKWSYAKLDENGFVSEVAEKNVISDNATVGIYFWKKGSDYVKYADKMIEANDRTNNEFYVCPVFNHAIKDNKKFKIKEIKKMWGLGTPEDLEYFINNYDGEY
jgi:beta-phosphoglucomutase-like phosphatase (HAD superfamily)/dTDP-glucose pyrophosphorylase